MSSSPSPADGRFLPGQPMGTHLIADLTGCRGLADPRLIEQAMRGAIVAAGAQLLDLKLHHFGPEQGVTGVGLLAESHLSIHTWPEHRYAAVDIFLCRGADAAYAALRAMTEVLQPTDAATRVIARGLPTACRTASSASSA